MDTGYYNTGAYGYALSATNVASQTEARVSVCARGMGRERGERVKGRERGERGGEIEERVKRRGYRR